MSNSKYSGAINAWGELLKEGDVKKIGDLLRGGTFVIHKEEYDKNLKLRSKLASPIATRIHYYFGIENGELKVYIINSAEDKNREFQFVIEKTVEPGINISQNDKSSTFAFDHSETKEQFLENVFNWSLLSHNWLEHRHKTSTDQYIFRGITNPYKDLSKGFDILKYTSIHHFFALKHKKAPETDGLGYRIYGIDEYEIDLYCFLVEEGKETEYYHQVSWPFFADSKKYQPDNLCKDYEYNLF